MTPGATDSPVGAPTGPDVEPSPPPRDRRRLLPWLTFVLIGVNVAVGVAALIIGGFSGYQNLAMLTFLGAKVNVLIQAGQYWRLVTAGFLHIGVFHLLSNMLSLLFIGTVVEAFYGRWRYLMLYTLTGVAGMAASYLMQPNLSAGASASVFGLVGALIAHNWKYKRYLPPAILQRMSILVPLVFVQLAFGMYFPQIDQRGHIGGLAAGLLLGFLTESRVAGHLQNEREWLPFPAALATTLGLLAYALVGLGLNARREWPLAQGAMAEARGNAARAVRYYELGLKREPQLAEVRGELIETLQRERRMAEAQEQLNDLRRRSGGEAATEAQYFQFVFREAGRLAAAHQPREAVARYREALTHAPSVEERANVQNNLAYLLADSIKMNYEEALELSEAATTAEPDNGVYLDTLAWVYYRLGKYPEAERVQQLALRHLDAGPLSRMTASSDDEAILQYHLARIFEAEGKRSQAAEQYGKAIATGERSSQEEVQQTVRDAREALQRLGQR